LIKILLQRLIRFLAYLAAGIVILLAIAVGLFRLFLPRLPEYQDEIKAWASGAIGMQVEFSGMNARWGLSGPQLDFYNARLVRNATRTRVIAADQVSVGVALTRLLFDRTLVVDRISVQNTTIEVRQLPNGRWWVQGTPAESLFDLQGGTGGLVDVAFVAENVELQLIRPGDERPRYFDIDNVIVTSEEQRLAMEALVRLPASLGRQLRVDATQLLGESERPRGWDVSFSVDDLSLATLAGFVDRPDWPLTSGKGELEASIAWVDGRVQSATAEFAFDEVTIELAREFSVVGRAEYRGDENGWLAAVDEFRISTADGTWPESYVRIETGIDGEGELVMVDARSDYVNLGDLNLFAALLDEDRREIVAALSPEGIVRNLDATLADIDTGSPRFAVSADLEGVGIAADGNRPGLRGFTGLLRADTNGGRLEMRSKDMVLDLARFLGDPVPIDEAEGTIIWRRGGDQTTVMSDKISIANSVLHSETSFTVKIEPGQAPDVDMASAWSISDIGSAKRFIPGVVMHPKLYDWFQSALVSGHIPSGSTRLYGPLDKFPFDGGEGRFLLQADLRDMTFKFHKDWPAAEIIGLDVVLDNTRLYSEHNRSINRGREIVDAKVEIDDVRKPVLTIDSFSTGTLESIHAYAQNSPIGRIFGGQMKRVRVAGDASFKLDLMVPITDWRSFTFTARIVANDGSLVVEGFDPPVTGLTGAVTIDRETVASEALGGQFLGHPVSIEVMKAPEDLPKFQVLAIARGEVDATGLVDQLGLPVDGLVDGITSYSVDLLFPRGEQEQPEPFTVRVSSDLVGLSVDLPEPLAKPAGEQRRIDADIVFESGGQRIESRGATDSGIGWQIAFTHDGDIWDLERGTVALGGTIVEAAETRGLHILGDVENIRFQDWLQLSRGDAARAGTAERIRSIDVHVENLRLLGQHLRDHRVRVDRSARDWLVQFEGDSVTGSVFVPYDFGTDRALVLDMERLLLPGDDEHLADASEQVDPRNLPPISLTAQQFAIGEHNFGSVETQFAKTPEGLVADSLLAVNETFEIVGNARWVADETDPVGHRSFLMATLTSTDIETTMQRLAYQPGIVGDDMTMLFDLSWSGGPRTEMLDTLDGDVRVRFGPGQLNEVEPGPGRLFGLMSIVALPRRLSLDFTDVFDKGFGFDQIDGSFHIVDGEAYTCNLALEGPAAEIAIIGRASLTQREYEQVAAVRANFGNTLPVVGAVVAGPQVAAALLIFSQIFKKPLQEMGQVYYGINGSWDDPAVESTDAANFASRVELAGCIQDSE
jgi:uncharacterized protein (TIGR02099 family)